MACWDASPNDDASIFDCAGIVGSTETFSYIEHTFENNFLYIFYGKSLFSDSPLDFLG